MKKITADYIFTLDSEPRQDAVIILDADGTILDITDLQPFEKVERYSGIICPGFVNTHCHLELSHLKGAISKKTGLVKFIQGVQKQRRKTSDQILKAIEEAEKEMVDAGIVAVGDISNTHHTIKQKQKGNLYYHTFVEAFGFSPGRAQAVFDERLELKDRFEQKGLSASITPHAMYSTSKELMELI
ncbi:MAG: cytosine/adenosine deaminase-related metal-dependent hydrolase, partial [Sphingobacteriales bacterium]